MREIGTAGAICLAVPAIGLMLVVRRRGGALHMLRRLVGAGLLFLAVNVLGKQMPDWSFLVPGSTPGAALDAFFQQIYVPHLLGPAMVAIAGLFMFLWPAGRRRSPVDAVVGTPVMQAPSGVSTQAVHPEPVISPKVETPVENPFKQVLR